MRRAGFLVAVVLVAVAAQGVDFGALVQKMVNREERDKRTAEQMFQWLRADQTDSLYAHLAPQVQRMVTPAQLGGQMAQLEGALGVYRSHSPWQTELVQGHAALVSHIAMEQGALMAFASFDNDGKALAFSLVPDETAVAATTATPLPAGVVERDTVVVTGDYRLGATLCMPADAADAPIVVLVHGSGPLDRDENIGPNHPFRDLAHQLAAQGIGTLRYDKRTKVYKEMPANYDEEVCDDAVSAIALAAGLSSRVYLLGHSQGGMLAPRIARRAPQLAGVVLMAAPARTLREIVIEQIDYLMPQSTAEQKEQQVNQVLQRAPYMLEDQHQTELATRLTCPILVLQGEKDYQVRMTDYELWRKALSQYRDATFQSFPTLTHLMTERTVEGLSTPADYIKAQTMSPQVGATIAAWIATH